jgi:hypothetical protein
MTDLLIVLTVVIVFTVVLVLVGYLLGIIYCLWSGKNALAALASGLVAVRDNTQPLGGHLEAINGGLSTLLSGLLDVNSNLAAIVDVAQGTETTTQTSE